MLILTMVSATLLILMTRHRVWLYSLGIGAGLAWSLWRLMALFERIVPLDWQAFNGVLAFLVLALLVIKDSLRVGTGWGDDGPRSGYFPFYVGLFLIGASGWTLRMVTRGVSSPGRHCSSAPISTASPAANARSTPGGTSSSSATPATPR